MMINNLGANVTELHLNNGTIVLFSYNTPVAAYDAVNKCYLRTSTKWSRTTSKHINKWLGQFGYVLVVNTDQSEIESLVGGV